MSEQKPRRLPWWLREPLEDWEGILGLLLLVGAILAFFSLLGR